MSFNPNEANPEELSKGVSGGEGTPVIGARFQTGITQFFLVAEPSATSLAETAGIPTKDFYNNPNATKVDPPANRYTFLALPVNVPANSFIPYGWDGDYSEAHEDLVAHAERFGSGRRVVPYVVGKKIWEALRDAVINADSPWTQINAETGEVTHIGALFTVNREGKALTTTYTVGRVDRKQTLAEAAKLVKVGTIVVPWQETLREFADRYAAAANSRYQNAINPSGSQEVDTSSIDSVM